MSGDAHVKAGRAEVGSKDDRPYSPAATAILDAAEELFCATRFLSRIDA